MAQATADCPAAARQMARLQKRGWTFKIASNGLYIKHKHGTTAFYGAKVVTQDVLDEMTFKWRREIEDERKAT